MYFSKKRMKLKHEEYKALHLLILLVISSACGPYAEEFVQSLLFYQRNSIRLLLSDRRNPNQSNSRPQSIKQNTDQNGEGRHESGWGRLGCGRREESSRRVRRRRNGGEPRRGRAQRRRRREEPTCGSHPYGRRSRRAFRTAQAPSSAWAPTFAF